MQNTSERETWASFLILLKEQPDVSPLDYASAKLSELVAVAGQHLIVAVKSDRERTVFERQISTQVSSVMTALFGPGTRLSITIDPTITGFENLIEPEPEPEPEAAVESPMTVVSTDLPLESDREVQAADAGVLNPKYTFENFVVGESNRFANAIAMAVAEQPGRTNYNPLLIYGDSGLGKTHLLHAIGNYVKENIPDLNICYVSSEDFATEFINAIRENVMQEFKQRYRTYDILLIDDIQFMAGKTDTMVEFFHTFDALYREGKQIVLTSDIAPNLLNNFEDRLKSRFSSGGVASIEPPQFETRMAILRNKAMQDNMNVKDDVLEFIATNITSNIRILEGALVRAHAYAILQGFSPTITSTRQILKDVISEGGTIEVTVKTIIDETARYYQLEVDDICGKSRTRLITLARQIAMYLCRELTNLSLPQVGQHFGGRDHSTVLHSVRKINASMQEREKVFNDVSLLTKQISNASRKE